LTQKFDFLALLILPNISVSTQKVYANYSHDQSRYEKLHTTITDLMQENRIDSVVGMCANMLEQSCFSLVKDLAEMKAEVESLDIGPVCLSGSGSAMFCIVDDMDAENAGALRDTLAENVGLALEQRDGHPALHTAVRGVPGAAAGSAAAVPAAVQRWQSDRDARTRHLLHAE